MASAQFSNGFIKPPPPFLIFAFVHVLKERLYWFFILKNHLLQEYLDALTKLFGPTNI